MILTYLWKLLIQPESEVGQTIFLIDHCMSIGSLNFNEQNRLICYKRPDIDNFYNTALAFSYLFEAVK